MAGHTTLWAAISGLLITASVAAASAADGLTQAEQEHINAMLAPVANPQANTEKVGGVPEDPAATVDSRFSYQGTLRLSGDRADGLFDFRFKLFDQLTGGVQLGLTQQVPDKVVTDGLFDTELDFGQAFINGDDLFLQIEVRDGASTGAYTVLSPRQRINATPYAVHTLSGGDGSTVVWTVNGGPIYRNSGKVGIGTATPAAKLHVQATNATPVKVSAFSNTHVKFYEQGVYRGYLGSWQTALGTTDADFEIGTGANSTGNMHITTKAQPRITVTADGAVGIGIKSPYAFTHILAAAGEDPLRVQTDNDISGLWVRSDGSTHFQGDVKQDYDLGGTLKAAAYIQNCGGSPPNPVVFTRQFNGVDNTPITGTVDGPGKCIITFQFAVTWYHYWTVNALAGPGNNGRGAWCDATAPNELTCTRYLTHLSPQTGPIMVLVY